jgi:hypothetical protein
MKLVHFPVSTVPAGVGFMLAVVASVLVWRFVTRVVPLPAAIKNNVGI